MRVTVLQLAASWGEPARALARVDAELERGAETDLVLLPELSLTGYVSPAGDFDPTPFKEPCDGPTAQALSDLARRRRIVLVAPLVLSEGRRTFNAMVAWDRAGAPIFTYRKRHPWIPETWASPGPGPAPTVDIDGMRVTIAICYDVHFLPEEATAALDAADLLLFPSAWVQEAAPGADPGTDSRPSLLAGLARRHRVAIANANWGRGVLRVPGQGSSCILAANGSVIASVPHPASSGRADAALP